jgi:hypothetical protein
MAVQASGTGDGERTRLVGCVGQGGACVCVGGVLVSAGRMCAGFSLWRAY